MLRAFHLSVLSAALGTLLTLPPAAAQSIFATIVGTVTDPTSAVVTGARVTVVNVGTNEKRQFTTDEKGNYEINNLFPGVYALEVETAGFAKYRQEQIELASKQNARIDIKLDVAGQATQIAVRSEGITPLETESAKLSDA